MPTLEICCYGIDCALKAVRAGADRIVLCTAPQEGGITSSLGVLRAAQELVLPVYPMVRPRGGDFCFSDGEFQVLLNDIAHIKDLGFPGIVTGILCPEGGIDCQRMRRVMEVAQPMSVIFHRAFDLCHHAHRAWHQLADLGVDSILSSGQQQSAEAGLPLLQELNQLADGPRMIAAGGVRVSNLPKFLEQGITELHSSASLQIPSLMHYSKAGVSMCSLTWGDEYQRIGVDADMVEAMQTIMQMPDAKPTRHLASFMLLS